MNRWFLAAMVACLLASPVSAQDGFDDAGFGEGGFGDGFDTEISAPSVDLDSVDLSVEVKAWSFYGFTKAEIGYSPKKKGTDKKLTKLQGTLNLSFDYKLSDQWRSKVNANGYVDQAYQINGKENYTQGTLDAYEQEFELRDTYVEGSFSSGWSVKVGRQILAWGQSDSSQINDMANPRDNRELGMVDIEDARIPVGATKIAWVNDGLELDIVALHEFRANKVPGAGSEFDMLASARAKGVQIASEQLPTGQDGGMLRLFKSFNGGDLAAYYSDTYSDSFYLDLDSVSFVGTGASLSLVPKYSKVKSVGFAANQVFGSMLVKGEIANKQGVVYGRKDLATQIGGLLKQGTAPSLLKSKVTAFETKDLNQVMVGIEYQGLTDVVLSSEVSFDQVKDWHEQLNTAKTGGGSFTSASYNALNDTLSTRLIWFHMFNSAGDVYRINIDYDLMDALNISAGMITYQSPGKTSLLEAYGTNDRLISAIKYSF